MRLILLAAAGGVLLAAGCTPPAHWQPPPPSGRTWQYDAQGALRETRSFGGGTGGAISYGYYFGGKSRDVPPGTEPDKFWRQQTVNYGFNKHLSRYGERIRPGARGPQVTGRSAPSEEQ